ncbi:hypothetical protein WR25_04395 isoform C [Diploscapter pachys]|uniref:CCHC-type domain-containing protein n=1 Tax=Diploscapter pachys TaxID=2018661 RepID=A0A2A2KCZ7_9BILA|nr:hypothetical protein WR25_04395 isoform B [Diploscapter pachys]PAV71742.1 hypothetical protein WR25_04395 isoform C [Diploscapter pachys]
MMIWTLCLSTNIHSFGFADESTGTFASNYISRFGSTSERKAGATEDPTEQQEGSPSEKSDENDESVEEEERRTSQTASVYPTPAYGAPPSATSFTSSFTRLSTADEGSPATEVANQKTVKVDISETNSKTKEFTLAEVNCLEQKSSFVTKSRGGGHSRRRGRGGSRRNSTRRERSREVEMGGASGVRGNGDRQSEEVFCRYCKMQPADHLPKDCIMKKCSRCRQVGHKTRKCPTSAHIISLSAGFDKAATAFRQSNDQMKDDAKTSFKHNTGNIFNPFVRSDVGFDRSNSPFLTIGRFGGGDSTNLSADGQPKKYGAIFNRALWDASDRPAIAPANSSDFFCSPVNPFEVSTNPFTYESTLQLSDENSTSKRPGMGFGRSPKRTNPMVGSKDRNVHPTVAAQPEQSKIDAIPLPTFDEFLQWKLQQAKSGSLNPDITRIKQESLKEYLQMGETWIDEQVKKANADANRTTTFANANLGPFVLPPASGMAQSQSSPFASNPVPSSHAAVAQPVATFFPASIHTANQNQPNNPSPAVHIQQQQQNMAQTIMMHNLQQQQQQTQPSNNDPLSISYYGCGNQQWMTIVLKAPRITQSFPPGQHMQQHN